MKLAAVVPSYKVSRHIVSVVTKLLARVDTVYVVDDCCPEGSGGLIESSLADPRVHVLHHEVNRGVGAAMITGYRAAYDGGADIVIKVDGDDQMDVDFIPALTAPIRAGAADYTKGNRFYELAGIKQMPAVRILGNAVLSFFAKASSGYWTSFDPTNGYTAIHASLIPLLLRVDIAQRYFFETDMLFRLGTLRAVVEDVAMPSRYGDEVSNLRISRILAPFLWGHTRNSAKRIFYAYFLRGTSVATLQLILGLCLFSFGTAYGVNRWDHYGAMGIAAPSGVVMLAALTFLSGLQLLLAFTAHDFATTPTRPIHPTLSQLELRDGTNGNAEALVPTQPPSTNR